MAIWEAPELTDPQEAPSRDASSLVTLAEGSSARLDILG
jgi:hypothetical protein